MVGNCSCCEDAEPCLLRVPVVSDCLTVHTDPWPLPGALVTVSRDVVASIPVNNGGSGYSSAPTVTIDAPTLSGGQTATATATISGGSVVSIAVTYGGAGYVTIPGVSLSGGGGSGATATASISSTVINSGNPEPDGTVACARVTVGGSGYTSAPTVTLSAPPSGGVQAEATAGISGGSVNEVVITERGSGYLAPPTVSFSGGGGSGAAAYTLLGQTAEVGVVEAGYYTRTVEHDRFTTIQDVYEITCPDGVTTDTAVMEHDSDNYVCVDMCAIPLAKTLYITSNIGTLQLDWNEFSGAWEVEALDYILDCDGEGMHRSQYFFFYPDGILSDAGDEIEQMEVVCVGEEGGFEATGENNTFEFCDPPQTYGSITITE
jgi:hypothetical protein